MRTSQMTSAVAALAVALAACGGGDVTADPSPTVTVTQTVAPTEDEGEGRDPASLFGIDVCTALLPALDGELDGLDRYATAEVLAELEGPVGSGYAAEANVAETDTGCAIFVGDVTFDLELLGDGHVGQAAVSVVVRTDYEIDEAAVTSAVAEYRASPEACDGEARADDAHVTFSLDGGHVVAVLCDTFAYQSTWELMGFDGTNLVSLDVEQWRGGLETTSIILGYPSLDEDSGQLVNFEKARGVGDCGRLQEWFSEPGRLGLAVARERDCSDDAEYVEPDEWPIVYPSGD